MAIASRHSLIFLILWLFAAALAGCSPKIAVQSDYNPDADFDSLRSYSWMAGKAINPDDPLTDTLTQRKIQSTIDKILQSRDFTFEEEGYPDFIVITYLGVENKIFVTDYGFMPGSWWGYVDQNIDVSHYEEGTLFIDMYSASSKELIWRGAATGVIEEMRDSDRRDEMITETVTRILEEFPP